MMHCEFPCISPSPVSFAKRPPLHVQQCQLTKDSIDYSSPSTHDRRYGDPVVSRRTLRGPTCNRLGKAWLRYYGCKMTRSTARRDGHGRCLGGSEYNRCQQASAICWRRLFRCMGISSFRPANYRYGWSLGIVCAAYERSHRLGAAAVDGFLVRYDE
jgi:hypothetical protein